MALLASVPAGELQESCADRAADYCRMAGTTVKPDATNLCYPTCTVPSTRKCKCAADYDGTAADTCCSVMLAVYERFTQHVCVAPDMEMLATVVAMALDCDPSPTCQSEPFPPPRPKLLLLRDSPAWR